MIALIIAIKIKFVIMLQVKEPPGAEKVCGSDGVTHDNECALKRASCTNQTLINISYVGACGKQHILRVL